MLKNLIFISKHLMTDIYGNYVIQYLLSLNDSNFNSCLIKYILNDLVFLSKQKYSSNVIEKVKKL